MPLNLHSGGPVEYVKDRKSICLTSNQARYIYIKIEKDGLVNVEMIKPEIEEDRLDNNNNLEEENLYRNMIINNFEKTMLITVFHKWHNGQYSVMLLIILGILEIILN